MQTTIKYLMISVIFLAMIGSGCKKDNDTNEPPYYSTTIDYGKLKIGNYWIYEKYYATGTNPLISQNVFDSTFIEKDTMIDGKKYYKMGSSSMSGYFCASGTIENGLYTLTYYNLGVIFISQPGYTFADFAYTNSVGDTLQYTKVYITEPETVNVTAGDFITIGIKDSVVCSPLDSNIYSSNIGNTMYSNGVGKILSRRETTYKNPPNYRVRYEDRLVRYHLN